MVITLIDIETKSKTNITLMPDGVTIGRSDNAHVTIKHPKVSSEHCILTVDDETQQLMVTDCGSKNGTFVKGLKVGKGGVFLQNNDILTVGVNSLRVEIEDAPERDEKEKNSSFEFEEEKQPVKLLKTEKKNEWLLSGSQDETKSYSSGDEEIEDEYSSKDEYSSSGDKRKVKKSYSSDESEEEDDFQAVLSDEVINSKEEEEEAELRLFEEEGDEEKPIIIDDIDESLPVINPNVNVVKTEEKVVEAIKGVGANFPPVPQGAFTNCKIAYWKEEYKNWKSLTTKEKKKMVDDDPEKYVVLRTLDYRINFDKAHDYGACYCVAVFKNTKADKNGVYVSDVYVSQAGGKKVTKSSLLSFENMAYDSKDAVEQYTTKEYKDEKINTHHAEMVMKRRMQKMGKNWSLEASATSLPPCDKFMYPDHKSFCRDTFIKEHGTKVPDIIKKSDNKNNGIKNIALKVMEEDGKIVLSKPIVERTNYGDLNDYFITTKNPKPVTNANNTLPGSTTQKRPAVSTKTQKVNKKQKKDPPKTSEKGKLTSFFNVTNKK